MKYIVAILWLLLMLRKCLSFTVHDFFRIYKALLAFQISKLNKTWRLLKCPPALVLTWKGPLGVVVKSNFEIVWLAQHVFVAPMLANGGTRCREQQHKPIYTLENIPQIIYFLHMGPRNGFKSLELIKPCTWNFEVQGNVVLPARDKWAQNHSLTTQQRGREIFSFHSFWCLWDQSVWSLLPPSLHTGKTYDTPQKCHVRSSQ